MAELFWSELLQSRRLRGKETVPQMYNKHTNLVDFESTLNNRHTTQAWSTQDKYGGKV